MGLLSTFALYCRVSLAILALILLFSIVVAYSQTAATSVPLLLPSAIAFDSQGNLYIAETARHIVRKVDSTGNMTTIAGTGIQGFDGDGGQATQALLDSPRGLAVHAGNLYISDSHNHRIRCVDLKTAVITTIAGGSSAGAGRDGGSALNASLDLPVAMAVDTAGNLYVADARAHRIRKIDTTGRITTVAGSGDQGFDGEGANATTALLNSPNGIGVDSVGNLYIADTNNNRIRKVDPSTGVITTLAGNGQLTSLALPRGVSLDVQGNVYIADAANHRIRRIDSATGAIATIAGDGTQMFAGDGSAPVQASLDTPQGVSFSPAGAMSIADTANARIRQVVDNTSLRTIAGLGTTIPGMLTLTGPSVVSYGSGFITARLNSSGATGRVTFFDSRAASTSTIAEVTLSANMAQFDTSTLEAGRHVLTATYAGDQTHSPAQSQTFTLMVSPISITATVVPASISYGQTIPQIVGTLTGILARDQANVSATFSTGATTFSSPGSYPVAVSLAGAAARNYVLASTPSLTITKAASATTLTAALTGQTVTLTSHVASTTSGTPTGVLTILDQGVPLTSLVPNASGDAVFSTSTLSTGQHSLIAAYSGDGNFTPSSSSPSSITIPGSPVGPVDFSLAPTGSTTQTIVSGASANFTFTVQPQVGLSSQISLAAAGLPNLATASFNPAYVPPGASVTVVTLTVATPRSALVQQNMGVAFALLPFAAILLHLRRRRIAVPYMALLLLFTLISATGCGDRVFTGTSTTQTPKSYTITVTGTATGASGNSIQHAATVTLVVAPAN